MAAPTVRRRRLGMALRRLRDTAEMTLEQASDAAGVSAPYVSRIERAQVAARVKVIKALLEAYHADEQTSAELLEIAGEAGRRGWWHRYSRDNLIPPEYAALIGFEVAASEIRTFEPMIVPGLLQVVPFAEGAYAGESPFVVLSFAGEDDVVFFRTLNTNSKSFKRSTVQFQSYSFNLDYPPVQWNRGQCGKQVLRAVHGYRLGAGANVNVYVVIAASKPGRYRVTHHVVDYTQGGTQYSESVTIGYSGSVARDAPSVPPVSIQTRCLKSTGARLLPWFPSKSSS
jgi:transcriptional regulator with XRE-family HTH domain